MDHVYRRWADRFRGPAGDLTVVAAVAVVVFAGTAAIVTHGGGETDRPIWPGGVGLMAVAVAALVWRRQHPVPALALTAVAAAAYYLLGYPAGLEPLPFLVALYGAAGHGYRLVAAVSAVLATAMVGIVELADGDRGGPAELLVVFGWLTVIIVVAEVVHARRAYLVATEQRAVAAERGRESEAARQVMQERLRIARELHDVLAHHISVINIQAGAALLRKESRPELAHEVLPVIKQAAGDAMRELRATLNVLRSDEDGETPLAPRPSLGRLAELIGRAEAGGLTVRTVIEGDTRDLPADVDLAAYRIVQEALTNVVRHAGAVTATVLIAYRDRELALSVDDDGHRAGQAPPDPGGNGLNGMRERATAIGGELRAGPRDGGGFRVYARLPVTAVDDPA